jgi:molybdopterin biosynthesis enzyme
MVALTPLAAALDRLLPACRPVAVQQVPLAAARGAIAAGSSTVAGPVPAQHVARIDGFACVAADLAGASPYSPVPLAPPPVFVTAGDVLPDGCDCVLEEGALERAGSLLQAVAEAVPGEGVRRRGEDMPAGAAVPRAGVRIGATDILAAAAAGLTDLAIRRPRLALIDIVAADGATASADLLAGLAEGQGAAVTRHRCENRKPAAIADAVRAVAADFVVTIGGTGAGPADGTAAGLRWLDPAALHGLAIAPGRTTAAALSAGVPVLACPGEPAAALAAWWLLGLPLLDALAGDLPPPPALRPLARKIASRIGLTEVVLLRDTPEGWLPLAVGDLPLGALAQADAFAAIAAGSEGCPAGAVLPATPLRNR